MPHYDYDKDYPFAALTHPDQADLDQAAAFAREALSV